MESKLRITRGRIIAISILLVLVIALSIASGITLYTESGLNELQQTALQELEENSGEYDEQKIVLYDTSVSEANMLAEKFNAALRITSDGKFATLTLSDGTTVADVYSARANRKYLSELSLDYYAKTSEMEERLTSTPNYTVSDTYYSYQSYINYLNIGDAWTTTRGGSVTVAIIDTGIDTDHSEFTGKISEYSYNATEDKIVKDYTDGNGDYDWSLIEDEQGHGTSVAGVIAASMDGNGTVGISPEVNLIIIKAECDENGQFTNTSDLVFGLYYAIEMDADVVNMSFGTYGNNVFASATKLAVDSDVICVAAAGNDATTSLCYPAADENVIGVGALAENSWTLAAYSNYGENSDIVAPGTTYTTKMGGGYGISTGTSLASPVVAGAIALYLSQNKYSEFSDVVENLYASCYDLGSLGDDWEYGYGALDINAFICETRGTVTFDMLTDELDDIEQIFVVNHTLQNIPEPERTYAVFDGWYYDIECTDELNWYEDVFTSDLTLYAKWVNEDDGIPYTYVTLDDGTIEIRSYTGKRRYITIPDMIDGKVVSSIGDEAFSGETRLRQINLPSGLTNIGRNAFYNCSNLLEIEIPEGVANIGENAFYNCTRLSSVAFTGSSKLTTVGDYAFAFSGLTRFELPSSLRNISGSAFYGATSLKAITVASGNMYFCADGGVLFNYTKSTIVAYPAGISGNYTVPESVTTISAYAFAYAKIKNVDLTNVTTIGNYCFSYSSLESLTIPDCVTSMGTGAFAYNFYLKTVTLGAGLTGISDECFAYCSMLASIEIPAEIISIGSSALAYTGLTQVTFASGSNLLYICSYAFYYTPITETVIPASAISIGAYAFACDYYLSSVTFENNSNLQTIGSSAFYYNIKLTEIELPENLQIIGDYAFMESGLKTVTLPASLTSLGAGAFASCHSLTEINVESANAVYISIDGVVYTIGKTTIAAYPAGNSATEYTIEDTVTMVGEAAFYGSWNLITVNLPSNLETISEYGFYDCENITGYTLPEGFTYIEAYAFSKNYSLLSLAMPDSVYQISNYAFAYDDWLTSITFTENSTLPRISFAAFAYCGLTSFGVPASVSTISQGAFLGCDSLTGVTFAANSKLPYISAYMFDGCSSLQTIIFESGSSLTSIEAHGLEGMTNLVFVDFGDAQVTNIDNYAFRYCESLTTVNIPEGVTYIGRYAFYGCKSLVSLTLPSTIDYIGRYAFYAYGVNSVNIYFAAETLPENLQENWDYGIGGYYVGVTDVTTSGDWSYAVTSNGNISIIKYNGSETSIDLTTVDLGGDITSIGGYAFYNTSVSSIVLPETLTSIQSYAFARSKITEITIPDSVTFIGQYAFFYTPLTSVTFGENSALKKIEQYAFYYTKSLKEMTLPASLTTLGSYAFYYSGITQVNFADGITITEIPAYAFANSGLTSVIIPDSVIYINDNAFRNCTDLTSLTFGAGEDMEIHSNAFYNTGLTTLYIPANVRYIGEYAFVGLTSLTSFVVSGDNPNYSSYDGLLYNKDQRKLIAVPAAKTGTIYLPESLETIGYGAFENTAAEAVVFDDNSNMLAIGYRAFYNAQNLTSVYIPASVVTIDFYAFAMCSNLNTVTFAEGSKLTGVYEGAFYGCISLENIVLPDSIIEISDYAFYGCSSLKVIPISETSELKGIYDYAFAYTGITELVIPDTVIDIGDYAFRGAKLKTVYIPDTNATQLIIGIGAFADCENLVEITLPFIGASFEDDEITWFGYIFGAGGYEANSTYVPESLKTVTITEGITFVGIGAFYGLTNLEKINVPYSVSMIYSGAFFGTSAIYELTNTISIDRNEISGSYWIFGTGISGSLILAEGITSIKEYAFYNCNNLISIEIPSSVTSIGSCAFGSCSSLTSIIFKDDSQLVDLGNTWTFIECSSLKSIEIPSGVTIIGDSAFSGCNSLTSVKFGENSQLTSIEWGAFASCSSLTSIEIPSNVTSIGDYVFLGCNNLYQVTNNSDLVLEIGSTDYGFVTFYAKLLIDKDGNKTYKTEGSEFTYVDTTEDFRFIYESGVYTLIAYFGTEETVTLPESINNNSYDIYYMRGVKNVIIPEGVTEISDGAFLECSTLKSITIADSIINIGSYAFNSCNNLTSVIFGENSQLTSIGDMAFRYCRGLTSIVIPSGVTNIGSSAFENCSSLTGIEIPSGVTSIRDNTFENCSSLTNIGISSGITSIGSYTFHNCYNLKSIEIPSGVTSIGSYAFQSCSSLTNIEIPSCVKSIGDGAFSGSGIIDINVVEDNAYFLAENGILYNATKTQIVWVFDWVTSIVIPNTVTDITSVFYGKSNIISVFFEEGSALTYIGSYAFYGCSSLVSIEIPSEIINIGSSAFEKCSSLTAIEIPSSVTNIGSSAFKNCSSLTAIEIPSSVTNIGSSAFENCSSLTGIEIPSGVTSIGQEAFYYCTSLTSIVILSGVTSIGSSAFGGCSSLTTIEIPSSVTSIGDSAFSGCSSLTSIEIPSSVTTIGYMAFVSCKSLTSVTFVGDSQIESIGDRAFEYCSSLTSIEIPNGVTIIGSNMFYYCISLTHIELSSGITSIGDNAFQGCSSLSTIEIPSGVTNIGNNAFGGCSKLYQVINNSDLELTLGSDDIGGIAYYAKIIVDKDGNKTYKTDGSEFTYIDTTEDFRFMYESGTYTLIEYIGTEEIVTLPESINGNTYNINYMRGVQNVIIPEGFTKIDDYAFYYCTSLTSILIPNGVTSIGNSAFMNCSSLTSIEIPGGVTSIGSSAFMNCSNLAYIEIPSGVTSIGYAAFYFCTSLVNIEIPSSVTFIGSLAFMDCTNLTSIEIPSGVTSIGQDTFFNCISLASITIPDSITSIFSYYAFYNTAYYNDSNNWVNGCLYIGNCLIRADTSVTYVDASRAICVAGGAFDECYSLIQITIGGNLNRALYGITNLETLIITEMPTTHYIYDYFGGTSDFPLTLQTIVIKDTAEIKGSYAFNNITGVTIYVEASELDVMWDEDYPGWNNGNYVYYGGEWISAVFYDVDGNILDSGYYLTSQVVRQPFVADTYDEQYTYTLEGWDINGDGKADSIPATSTSNIVATAIIKAIANQYTVYFYDSDRTTLLYSQTLAYGETITLPDEPVKTGYTFTGWSGYTEGMTVTGDTYIYATWEHTGSGHEYGELLTKDATCDEDGYTYYQCSVCGDIEIVDIISATGHNYGTELLTKDATCEEDGYTYYLCSVCGGIEIVDIIEATGHSYGEWITEVEATCLTDGSRYHVCEVCGHIEYEVVEATGHNYVGTITREATCTEEGEITYVCEHCGDTITETIEMTEHNYVKKYASKTWIQWLVERLLNIFFGYEGTQGYYYECADCRHIMTGSESMTTGTASVEGVSCNHTNLGEYELILAATCEDQGIYGQYCLDCGELVNTYTVDSLGGHVYGEIITVDVTCTEEGYTYHICTVCGEKEILSTIPATGHTASEAVVDNYVAVTCTTDGSYDVVVYCSVCGAEISRETVTIPATGHTESEAVKENEVAATCTTYGSYDLVVYCSVCGAEISRKTFTISATGHNYESVVTDPTCTEGGYTTHTCSVCGDSYIDSEIEALGHSYELSDWTWNGYESVTATFICVYDNTHVEVVDATITSEVTTSVTCTEKGIITYTATVTFKGETYLNKASKVIAATGHTESESIIENYVAATCTTDGSYDLVVYCSICGAEIRRETFTIYATGHNYESIVTEPTCTENGYTTHICSMCGYSYIYNETVALGHSYELSGWTWNGYESTATFICANDSTHVEIVNATITSGIITSATCTETGIRTYTATVTFNGQTYSDTKTEVISATGHTSAEAVSENYVAATCTTDGSYDLVVYCSVCGKELSRETVIVPAIGHTASEAVVDNYVAVTCTTDGSYDVVVYCSVCGAEISRETVTIPATGHTESEAVTENYVAATCTTDGSYDLVVYCSICGAEIRREIFTIYATGHNYESIVTEPTCTENGYTTHTCSICGDSYVDSITEALGHSYELSEWTWNGYESVTATFICVYDDTHVEVVDATITSEMTTWVTCTEKGIITYTATVTFKGDTYLNGASKVIAATGHTESESVIENYVAATCTTDGSYDLVVYCSICGAEIRREIFTIYATGHNYESIVTEPTCTENGYTTHICSTCGYSYIYNETVALGHSYELSGWTWNGYELATATFICSNDSTHVASVDATITNEITTSATSCTETGIRTYTATVTFNGQTYSDTKTEVIPATGHNYGETLTVDATCIEDGYTYHICTVCGEEEKLSTISATGHTASEAVKENEVAATCTMDGSYDLVIYCSICGEELNRETVTIPAIGHTASEAVKENEVAATCTTDGSYDLVVYCSVCGVEISRETVTIPATGHTASEAVKENEVAATCTTDGSYDLVVYCSVCGEEISRETVTISAIGHTASEAVKENEVAATCTTDGSYDSVVYCSVCGEELSRENVIVSATGHSYGTPTWNWAEDYSSATAVFTCTSCGNKREVTAIVTSEITKEATTLENGVKTYTATVTFEGVTYTSTKTEEIEKLKAGSGCGTISGADVGSGNLLMIAFTTLTLFAVYTIARRRKNKAQ